ncbi:GNAT family N-acetyltransferase [Christiangramia aquimixticola]|uniref:GNAT family N-acetyltransferase n=1 Tax=Christiangramia aquimixticola TaxID=1697558 RepID=UPI003AA9DE2F
MVKFRIFNFDSDAKQVISLINKNLNPNYSEENLIWKHYKNPHQISTGAVAVKNSSIIACVFYMSYDLKLSTGERIKAARPVDGCTALEERGKGVFKKLMKYCLENFHYPFRFLFANPNQFSFPEFLKMGWERHAGYQYFWGIIKPLHPIRSPKIKLISLINFSENSLYSHFNSDELRWLNWRYEYKKYKKVLFNNGNNLNLLIYRCAKMKGLRTLIICDYLGSEKHLNEIILEACKLEKTIFIYYLSYNKNSRINCLLKVKHKDAVIVTTPKLNPSKNIFFTLADLEGTT